MTMSLARSLSLALQGGFYLRILQCPTSINVVLLGFCASIMTISPCRANMRSRGTFAFAPLVQYANCLFEGTGILKSKLHLLPLSEHPTERAQKNHSSIAGSHSSSSRSRSSRPGDWEECSVPQTRLIELQTQGFLPPAFMVPV